MTNQAIAFFTFAATLRNAVKMQTGAVIYLVSSFFCQGLLGPKKELWDLLQLVEKKDSDATDITASVRELPTVK